MNTNCNKHNEMRKIDIMTTILQNGAHSMVSFELAITYVCAHTHIKHPNPLYPTKHSINLLGALFVQGTPKPTAKTAPARDMGSTLTYLPHTIYVSMTLSYTPATCQRLYIHSPMFTQEQLYRVLCILRYTIHCYYCSPPTTSRHSVLRLL